MLKRGIVLGKRSAHAMRLFVRLVNLLTAYTAEVEVDVITADARRLLYIMLEL